MNHLESYLHDVFSLEISLIPLNKARIGKLPLYLRGLYEFYESYLYDHKIIWAKLKDNKTWTPDQLQKQSLQIKHFLNDTIIFVFEQLQSWQRKRLIAKRIAFVQPFKQLYIPNLLVQLGEISHNLDNPETISKKLSAPAQLVLLYHLQKQSLENKSFQQLAEQLQYSAMTITRIVQELKNAKLINVRGSGRKKTIVFIESGKKLWEKASANLISPVREQWLTDELPNNNNFLIAGDTALSSYTLLAESAQQTFAIGKDEFRLLKTDGLLKQLDKKNGDFKIEVWLYNPMLLSNRKEVDRLSLYLSLRHHSDERIIRALDNLLNDMKWLED